LAVFRLSGFSGISFGREFLVVPSFSLFLRVLSSLFFEIFSFMTSSTAGRAQYFPIAFLFVAKHFRDETSILFPASLTSIFRCFIFNIRFGDN